MMGHAIRGGELVTYDAVVIAALAAGFFRVQIDAGCFGERATCRPSGKMQRSRIAIVPGDAVVWEFAAGCFSTGRIVRRFTGDASVPRPRFRRKGRSGRARQLDEQPYGDAA